MFIIRVTDEKDQLLASATHSIAIRKPLASKLAHYFLKTVGVMDVLRPWKLLLRSGLWNSDYTVDKNLLNERWVEELITHSLL